MANEDIGKPAGFDRDKARKDLISQLDRDERDEAVRELYEEARELYWQAGGSVQHGFWSEEADDAIQAVMRLCWEHWARREMG